MSGEVSIAELIGWEIWPGLTRCWRPTGADRWTNAAPTVDDLHAWLCSKFDDVEVESWTWHRGDEHGATVNVMCGNLNGSVHFDVMEPTFQAAFESMVRAVAAVPAEDDKP